jgi:hypothetical protein
MGIIENINILCKQMLLRGWIIIKQDVNYITLENNWIFTEKIDVSIPLNKKNKYYSELLESFLNNLIEIDDNFKSLPITSILYSQSKNIKQKFSKNKNNWILSEPNIKYNVHEIPDIYIPKTDIFDR